jgi:uncharacterized protein YkwD
VPTRTRTTLGALLATVLLATGTPLLLAEPASAASPAAERYGDAAFKVTNEKRVKHDRSRFKRQACVQKWARKQARRMARQERMFHQDLGPVLDDCGLSRVGENVAYGYPTGRAVVRGWMRSEGHRANILDRRFRLMGVAARKSDDGTWYAAQVFGRRG